MRDRLVDAVDHLGGDDRVLIFGVPVFVGGGLHPASARCTAASPRTSQPASISISTSGLRLRRRAGAIDQQGLGGAADAGAAHLGVQHDRLGHLEIGGVIDIDVVDAFEMREHRHARFGLDARDQALAAARHDHVDAAVQSGQQQADRGAVARRHQRDRGFRQTGLAQALHQAVMDGAAGAETVGAAAQDHGVAGFQAQHAGIGGDVGAALEDHAR